MNPSTCYMKLPTLFSITTEELLLLETQVHEARVTNRRTSTDDSASQQSSFKELRCLGCHDKEKEIDVTLQRFCTSIVRTAPPCPLALATSRGVRQSSFSIKGLAAKLIGKAHIDEFLEFKWTKLIKHCWLLTIPPCTRSSLIILSKPLLAAWCNGVPPWRPKQQLKVKSIRWDRT